MDSAETSINMWMKNENVTHEHNRLLVSYKGEGEQVKECVEVLREV